MKKGYIYVFFSTVLFSTMEIMLKIVSDEFNSIQITFLRFLIGSIVLLPLALKGLRNRHRYLKLNDYAFFALTGFICIMVSMVLYQMAILYSQASVVAVLFSCNPVFVVIFAFLIMHEKIYWHTIISIIICISGIIVIMNPLHMSGNFLGIVLTILAAIAFALYCVVGGKRSEQYGGVALTCFSFLFGSAEMFVFIMMSRLDPVSAFFARTGLESFVNIPIMQGLSVQFLPSLIYIGVFVTGLGYTFYFLAMEVTSAATASLVFFIKPALAPLLALAILQESITVNMTIGIILILIGFFITIIQGFRIKKNTNLKNPERDIEMDGSIM